MEENKIQSYNELKENIIFQELLGQDLYVTFKGQWKGKDAVIKFFFFSVSDENNEYEFMELMQGKNGVPIPYYKINLNYEDIIVSLDREIEINGVYKIIVYEFIEGEEVTKGINNKDKLLSDIIEQLTEIHRLGFVYGDMRLANIIKTKEEKYCLRDYGRTFSLKDTKYPPMKYMIDEEEVPTREDDLSMLMKCYNSLI